VFPTETSYGLAASIRHYTALERIFAIKMRPAGKPLLILADSIEQAAALASVVPPLAKTLMERFWPGPLTILLPAMPDLPFFLTGSTGRIGVRISSHPVARQLVSEIGHPITATSANLSGGKPPKTLQDVKEQFREEQPDYFLDAGAIPAGRNTACVHSDARDGQPAFLRR
jgi:L-threonylcarbamoyladenylate synthase